MDISSSSTSAPTYSLPPPTVTSPFTWSAAQLHEHRNKSDTDWLNFARALKSTYKPTKPYQSAFLRNSDEVVAAALKAKHLLQLPEFQK
jgi:hypothetical protein